MTSTESRGWSTRLRNISAEKPRQSAFKSGSKASGTTASAELRKRPNATKQRAHTRNWLSPAAIRIRYAGATKTVYRAGPNTGYFTHEYAKSPQGGTINQISKITYDLSVSGTICQRPHISRTRKSPTNSSRDQQEQTDQEQKIPADKADRRPHQITNGQRTAQELGRIIEISAQPWENDRTAAVDRRPAGRPPKQALRSINPASARASPSRDRVDASRVAHSRSPGKELQERASTPRVKPAATASKGTSKRQATHTSAPLANRQ